MRAFQLGHELLDLGNTPSRARHGIYRRFCLVQRELLTQAYTEFVAIRTPNAYYQSFISHQISLQPYSINQPSTYLHSDAQPAASFHFTHRNV